MDDALRAHEQRLHFRQNLDLVSDIELGHSQ
jgi:hypothetical protein